MGVLDSESGGGGLKSTVYDLSRLGQMYLNKGVLDGVRVLSPASIRELTTDHNSKLPQAEYEGQFYDSTWGLGWNVKGVKKDDCGFLRSSTSFEHGGFGCSKLLCDPEADVVITYFTVCKHDWYWSFDMFCDMVLGAITD